MQQMFRLVSSGAKTWPERTPHKYKQAAGALVSGLSAVLDPSQLAVDLRKHELSSADQLLDAFSEAVAPRLNRLRIDASTLGEISAAVDTAAAGKDDLRRQAGLYVDLVTGTDGSHVRTPDNISYEEADAAIAAAGRFFELAAAADVAIQVSPGTALMPPPDELAFLAWLKAFAALITPADSDQAR